MGVLKSMVFPLLALSAFAVHAATDGGVEQTADGLVVRPSDAQAADVRLQVVRPGIVRVTADPDGDFARTPSLMRVDAGKGPDYKVERKGEWVKLSTTGISAEVSTRDGQVRFFDAAGKPLVSERARSFQPVTFEGKPYYSVRQRFESPSDEAFYGTGLHQQGWMDLKGRDVELLQHNIDNAIPYLLSSRHYGTHRMP